MGEEAVELHSDEFIVLIHRDRGRNEWVEVGTKVRPRPRAPLRSYLLSRLIDYRDGSEPNQKSRLEAEARWLDEHEEEILDSSLINSEQLRLWDIDATRVQFGQKPRGKWPRRPS
jgi:hypothetical protein